MSWTIYGILILFGAFVLLMLFNPKLSCFGRRIASPLYPLWRKKRKGEIKAEDYGFHLAEGERPKKSAGPGQKTGGVPLKNAAGKKTGKPLKTFDYGFRLGGDEKTDEKRENIRQSEPEKD